MRYDRQVAMAGRAVTKVVHRCHNATEDDNLNLSECQLIAIPDAIYHLMRNTVVRTCDLSSNVLRKIPAKFAHKFGQITELNLSHNRLSNLPDELFDLNGLERLDLSYNDYFMIPRVVFKLPNLTYLNCRKNKISDVDVNRLQAIPNLREIDLQDNPLSLVAYEKLKALNSVKLTLHLTAPIDEDSDDDLSDLDVTPSTNSRQQQQQQ